MTAIAIMEGLGASFTAVFADAGDNPIGQDPSPRGHVGHAITDALHVLPGRGSADLTNRAIVTCTRRSVDLRAGAS